MITSEETIKLVARLIQLTKAGKLTWQKGPHILASGAADVRFAYSTVLDGTRFALFQEGRQCSSDGDHWYVITELRLAIIDQDGRTEFEFPEVNALEDLFETVRFTVAKVSDVIQKVVGAAGH